MIRLLLTIGLFLVLDISYAQKQLLITRANSKNVSVLDDRHLRKGYWYIMPELRPDYYVVENPKKPHKVTFYTDIDSISFDVKYNENHDFVILLNGKDSCFTRITTVAAKIIDYRKECKDCAISNDSIPFSLGLDNKTYIRASINKSKILDFQFDLGTTACILKESMAENCKMKWDGIAEMGSVTGTKKVKSSKFNEVKIKNLIWDSVAMFSTEHTGWGYKGIIGNSILQDKIVELNYDINYIIFHKELPDISKDYFKVEMEIRDGVPYIPITIDNGKTRAENWFMFDNGYDNCLLVDNEFARVNNLYGTMKNIGHRTDEMNGNTETVSVPKLFIGEFILNDVPIDLQNINDAKPYDRVIIGNDVLKRFNVIIDYKNNAFYLKPNKLLNEKYDKGNSLKTKVLIIGGSIMVIAIGLLLFKKYK